MSDCVRWQPKGDPLETIPVDEHEIDLGTPLDSTSPPSLSPTHDKEDHEMEMSPSPTDYVLQPNSLQNGSE